MVQAGRRRRPVQRTRLVLSVEPPFELDLVARSHGWYDLPPFAFGDGVLSTACAIEGQATDLRIQESGRGVVVQGARHRPWTDRARDQLRRVSRRMLGLNHTLTPFWSQCRRHPGLTWAARRGAGRMLSAPTLFEDLTKILFTTNCSWEFTRHMTTRLVERLGTPAPSGRRTFPSAARCARQGESFFREEVRAGYRSARVQELARRCSGVREQRLEAELCSDQRSLEDRRHRLGELPGIGPYAVGQGLRLLGRFEDLALDSWCRARWMELTGRRKAPTEVGVRRALRGFPEHQGLALWLWLTAHWHGEESPPWKART